MDLDYPDNKKSTVWLKDANVPYLEAKHLGLTVVTSVVLVLIFLYTILLLLGYKLYHITGRKQFAWLNKIKPPLDSYAPYKIRTRYWTGFLLLVRCALYIVFSFNSLGGISKSLLAIIVTFTAIVVIAHAWLSIKNYFVNMIEASVYMNLIFKSAFSMADANTQVFVNTLGATVFGTMIGIIV